MSIHDNFASKPARRGPVPFVPNGKDSVHHGALFTFEGVDEAVLIRQGLLQPDCLPGARRGCMVRAHGLKVTRCADGTVNARFDGDFARARDISFQQFLTATANGRFIGSSAFGWRNALTNGWAADF